MRLEPLATMESIGIMVCPRDESRLSKIGFSGINLDSCPNCDGVWLQRGELARLHGLGQDLLPGPAAQDPRGPARCPCCGEITQTRLFSDASKVLLDLCPACQGIWLDQAELTTILREVYLLKEHATVFVNRAGKAYHTRSCPRRGKDAQEIRFLEAQTRGKHACKQCRPPQIELQARA